MNRLLLTAVLTAMPGPRLTAATASPQAPAPGAATDEARQIVAQARRHLEWQRHLDDNQARIARGDTGRLLVSIPGPDGAPIDARVGWRVTEVVPDEMRPTGRPVVTRHFVELGETIEGAFVVDRIPTGLPLIVEVWPLDASAPRARFTLAGPVRPDQEIAMDAPLAAPYPVLTGRILDADGRPRANRPHAVEFARGDFTWHEEVRTDAAGRFRLRLRYGDGSGVGNMVMIPGRLVRSGGWLYTEALPQGPRAIAHLRWPYRGATALGDLRLCDVGDADR